MKKRLMLQCSTALNRDAITRETIDGVQHIVVSSFTLPDDIVMNGGLYPADEIAKNFKTLERTLAPVEHPQDAQGNFISATDPQAIHDFHAGAFNTNVTQENGRIHIQKKINVQEALKTERGKRLLDRLDEIENNENPRPVHTSVGVFLNVEELDKPKTNADGQEFTWIARDMFFDHDAILLDSIGAAQPGQGVGLAVNAKGEKFEVSRASLSDQTEACERVALSGDMRQNQDASFQQIIEQLVTDIQNKVAAKWVFSVDLFEDKFIFETDQGFFEVPYRVDNDTATIVGIPLRVERIVTYQPLVNSAKGEAMKDLILNTLKEAGVDTKDMDDAALMEAYNQHLIKANQSEDDDSGEGDGNDGADLAAVVASALKPVTDKLAALETQINSTGDAEHKRLSGIVANSGKYPGLDAAMVEAMPADTVKTMAANCGVAHGVPLDLPSGEAKTNAAPTDMPE